MRWSQVLSLRLRTLFQRSRVESELQVELRDHLVRETEANIKSGMSAEEAAYAAQRSLGSSALYEEQCRDQRGTGIFDSLVRDFRYAFRVLAKKPFFTAVAIVTLGLGTGANTEIFTLVNALLLRPLPVPAPQQLVSLSDGKSPVFSYPNYRDIRDRNNVFAGLAASRFIPVHFSLGSNRNFRVWGYEATDNYFDLLGVQPRLGSFFRADDSSAPGANPVVVLSYGCWQGRFAADPNVIGRRLKINNFDFTVVGVAQPNFAGTELIVTPEFWIPMSMERRIDPGSRWLEDRAESMIWLLGRLKPGITRTQAQASLARVSHQLAREYSQTSVGMRIELGTPGLVGKALRGPITAFAAVVTTVGALVLLLACINLAGLLLARVSDRRKEIAVRLSIGASRAQILRQLLTESFVLAAGGTVTGAAFALAASRALGLWHPPFDLPANTSFAPDAHVFFFAILIASVTALLCGLAPALHATRVDLVPALKSAAAHQPLRRLTTRDLLIVSQVALSVVLLISSVLVVRSLYNALKMNLGFNPEQAVSVSFDLGLQGYNEMRGREFQARMLAKASLLPGVQAAGLINNPPLRLGENDKDISIPGRPRLPGTAPISARIFNISPGYLRAAGTRLIAGRDIDIHDRAGTPLVALVNETFVREFFAGKNPVGAEFSLGSSPREKPIRIAGIVQDGKYEFLSEDPTPAVFVPFSQAYNGWTTVVVRTSLPAEQATDLLRRNVADLDSDLPLFNSGSLKDQLAFPLFPARLAAIILGAFGALAAMLAAIGVFAMVSFGVAQRSREIGIRMALGARAGQVLAFVLHRTVILCAAGIVAGTVFTFAAARLLSTLLYGVSSRDPLTYAIAISLMSAVAVVACWYPAHRAIRIDPAKTLRAQ